MVAAATGQAVGKQFGLVGALVSAGVSVAREAGRAKELRELYDAQQSMPVEQRLALNPLSRTIPKAAITAVQKGEQIVPTLKLSDGQLLPITSEERTVYFALDEWVQSLAIPVEVVLPKKFPKKVLIGIIAAPFALVALHFLISVPYALKNVSLGKERLAAFNDARAKIEPAFDAISGPTGTPLAAACGAVLKVPVDTELGWVGKLPPDAQKLVTESYADFPRYTAVQPPYSKWDTGKLDVRSVETDTKWAAVSFGQAYGRVIENPFGWSRVAERSTIEDLSKVKLYLVGKVLRVDTSGESYDRVGTGLMAVKVLDAQSGAVKCEGDLAVTFKPSTVGFGFMMSQALPLGLHLPSCEKDEGLCHEAHYYAKLAEPVAPMVAEASPPPAPAKKAPVPAKSAERKKH
ncbi:MAG: hypothetical protein QM723_02980 [Myxococcaceae bacterium]